MTLQIFSSLLSFFIFYFYCHSFTLMEPFSGLAKVWGHHIRASIEQGSSDDVSRFRSQQGPRHCSAPSRRLASRPHDSPSFSDQHSARRDQGPWLHLQTRSNPPFFSFSLSLSCFLSP